MLDRAHRRDRASIPQRYWWYRDLRRYGTVPARRLRPGLRAHDRLRDRAGQHPRRDPVPAHARQRALLSVRAGRAPGTGAGAGAVTIRGPISAFRRKPLAAAPYRGYLAGHPGNTHKVLHAATHLPDPAARPARRRLRQGARGGPARGGRPSAHRGRGRPHGPRQRPRLRALDHRLDPARAPRRPARRGVRRWCCRCSRRTATRCTAATCWCASTTPRSATRLASARSGEPRRGPGLRAGASASTSA